MADRTRARAKSTAAGGESQAAPGPDRASLVIASCWLISFFVCSVLGMFLLWDERISSEGFEALLTQLSQTYAVYVGATVTFVYTGRGVAGPRAPGNRLGVFLAIGVSLAFNAALVGTVTGVAVGAAKLQDALAQIAFLGQYLSWLVAPVLGYYFANPNLGEQR